METTFYIQLTLFVSQFHLPASYVSSGEYERNLFLKRSLIRVIRNAKIHRLHKISLVTPVLSWFILATAQIFYFNRIRFNIIIHFAFNSIRFPNVLPTDTSTLTVLLYLESSCCVVKSMESTRL